MGRQLAKATAGGKGAAGAAKELQRLLEHQKDETRAAAAAASALRQVRTLPTGAAAAPLYPAPLYVRDSRVDIWIVSCPATVCHEVACSAVVLKPRPPDAVLRKIPFYVKAYVSVHAGAGGCENRFRARCSGGSGGE